MKREALVLFAFLLISSSELLSQPTTITWQGKLLDNSGNAINQNNVAMTFAMFDASSGGNQLWPVSGVVTKTVDVVNGLYSVQLGTGTGDDIAFTAAMFDGHTPWLEVKVGTETLSRTEITTVPFALISNDLSAAAWETPGEIGKTTPNTGKFSTLETGSLKVTTGASDGKVLTSDAAGNASWTTPYTGLSNFTESNYTYDSKTGVKFTPNNAAANVDFVIQPKGNGAILAQQPDGDAAGNTRGAFAIDLQLYRHNASEVAFGNYSAILGGGANSSLGLASVVIGGVSNIASGSNSLASGLSSDATGNLSLAMGRDAAASNEYAVAIGNNPTASGYASLAMGDYTTASGRIASAFGNRTTAPSGYETVLGRYNTDYTPSSTTDWIATDRLFVVGNGATDVTKSNALTILKNANTTIGGSLTLNGNGTNSSITFPTTRGTSGQVLTSDGSGGTNWATPYSGLTYFTESGYTFDGKSGVRFLATSGQQHADMVLQPKGEGGILAQQPDGTTAGGNNRGKYAVDLQTTRTIITEVASGYASVITGGERNTANGGYSWVGGGLFNTANGGRSAIVNGLGNIASGQLAFVGNGDQNTASATSAFVGNGGSNVASGSHSFVGNGSANTASGDFSFVSSGISNTAPSYGETVMGYYATTYSPGTNGATLPNATDRLFSVGNGTSATRSNALTILKNANTTIGGTLEINKNGTNTSYTFPATRGNNGQVLSTNGVGALSWSTPTAGTVTSVTGTAPISVATGTTTPNISISPATTSAAGSMSAADKSKLDGIDENANNYTHPTGDGNLHVPATGNTNNGKVLTAGATAGSLSWTTPNTGLTNYIESNYSYASKTGVKFTPQNAASDVDFVIQPKGVGAIISQQPDGTTAGGNNRGNGAVDLQMYRTDALQVASGLRSVIIGGEQNIASGQYATAMGFNTRSYSTASTTMGAYTEALGQYATAMGASTAANGIYSIAMGVFTVADGNASTAMGSRTIAPSAYETVLGRYNSDYTPSSSTDWIATDRLFVVGNGASNVAKSNALTILKNANTTIGGSLTLNGNGTNTSITFPTSRGTSGQVLQSDGSGGISWATPASSQWTTSSSNIYFNSGNVGIGTTDLTQKLNVNGNVLLPSGSSYWIGNAADTGNRLRLHQSGSNAYIDWGEETLFFRSGVAAATNRVVFSGDGKVGIGTSAPKATLDLGNSVSNRKIALYSSADNNHQFTGFGLNNDALRFQLANTSGNFKFYGATSETASTELFRIQGNGQIVIPALTTKGVLLNSSSGVVSSSAGTSGQVLTTDASGNISWQNVTIHEAADQFSATASQTSFTLSQTPSANSKVKLFINGIRISNTAYTVSGASLTYIPENNGNYPLTAGDRIQMDYFYE